MTDETRRDLISGYLDDQLTPEERAVVEAMLDEPETQQLLAELESQSSELKGLPKFKLGDDFAERLLVGDQVEAAFQSFDTDSSASVTAVSQAVSDSSESFSRLGAAAAAIAALAAMVLLVLLAPYFSVEHHLTARRGSAATKLEGTKSAKGKDVKFKSSKNERVTGEDKDEEGNGLFDQAESDAGISKLKSVRGRDLAAPQPKADSFDGNATRNKKQVLKVPQGSPQSRASEFRAPSAAAPPLPAIEAADEAMLDSKNQMARGLDTVDDDLESEADEIESDEAADVGTSGILFLEVTYSGSDVEEFRNSMARNSFGLQEPAEEMLKESLDRQKESLRKSTSGTRRRAAADVTGDSLLFEINATGSQIAGLVTDLDRKADVRSWLASGNAGGTGDLVAPGEPVDEMATKSAVVKSIELLALDRDRTTELGKMRQDTFKQERLKKKLQERALGESDFKLPGKSEQVRRCYLIVRFLGNAQPAARIEAESLPTADSEIQENK